MKSKLEQLQEILDGTADDETRARIEAELGDSSSDVTAFFEVMRTRAEQFEPTDIDWGQFFELADDEEVSVVESSAASDESITEPINTDQKVGRKGDGNGTPLEPRGRSPWPRRRFRSLAVAIGLLICGVLLGRFVLPGTGEPRGIEVVSAQATTMRISDRGPNDLVPAIRILSEISGFVTIVSLAPDRRAIVYPSLGGSDYPVTVGERTDPLALPADTTAAVFVVTETPAGEPLRRAEERLRPYRPGEERRVREVLQQVLEEKGYRRMAFGDASFAADN